MTSTTPPSSPRWQHSPDQLAHTCAAELAAARAATARMGACLVEMDTRGIRDLFGYGSAASWLADAAGIGRGEAFTIVTRAKALNAGRHPDGTPDPALAPLTGAAALEGALSTANIDLITATLRTIPVEHRQFAEATLVELARVAGPRQVRECADDLLARLDPDGQAQRRRPRPATPDPVPAGTQGRLVGPGRPGRPDHRTPPARHPRPPRHPPPAGRRTACSPATAPSPPPCSAPPGNPSTSAAPNT